MSKNYSIAKRLTLWLVLGTAFLWLAAAGISSLVLRSELYTAYDNLLEQSAQRLLPLALQEISEDEDVEEILEMRQIFDAQSDQAQFTYFIRNPSGRFILSPDDLPDGFDSIANNDGFGFFQQQKHFTLTDQESGFSIVVLEKLNVRDDILTESVIGLFIPLFGLLPIIAIGVWYALRLALKPIGVLRDEIASKDERDLSPLWPSHHPKELEPIAKAIASLLERLRQALESERAFAGHYAHELRTPIAGALAQVQRLQAEIGSQDRLTNVEISLQRLSELSEKLLQLNRVETGFAITDKPHDLSQVVGFVIRDLESIPEFQNRINVKAAHDNQFAQKIDPDAFAILLQNLVKNALVHGSSNDQVLIKFEPTMLTVSNAGPIVSEDVLRSLGTRFVRGKTDAEGNGLGLAIVKAICEQINANLDFQSPRSGKLDGFEVRVKFNN